MGENMKKQIKTETIEQFKVRKGQITYLKQARKIRETYPVIPTLKEKRQRRLRNWVIAA
jgi:hypothetical protein